MWSFPQSLYNRQQGFKIPAVTLVERVIASAKSIVGQKEKPGNSGFQDAAFQKRMEEVGFLPGESWCVYTVEDIWKNGFGQDHPLYPELETLFSASATKTAGLFQKSELFQTGQIAQPGALALWRHGKGWQGHAGVVVEDLGGGKFRSVEGNTNQAGGREGVEVAIKDRKTGEKFKANGLNLVCFVYLPAG